LAWAVLTATVPLWAFGDLWNFRFASHTFLPTFAALAFCGLGAERRLLRLVARGMRRHGRDLRHVIVIGSGPPAFDMVARLARRAVITLFTGPPDSFGLLGKRLLDLSLSLVACLLLLPLFLVVAIAIKLDSRGSILFAQERVGLGGRRFRLYKFRTMIAGADRLQAEFEALNEAHGPVFKIRNDPRVTRVGRWLRHLSLDELPQMLNVLIGDMSLVGPRPLPLRDVQRIDKRAHKRRFSVKPGLTCLWQ